MCSAFMNGNVAVLYSIDVSPNCHTFSARGVTKSWYQGLKWRLILTGKNIRNVPILCRILWTKWVHNIAVKLKQVLRKYLLHHCYIVYCWVFMVIRKNYQQASHSNPFAVSQLTFVMCKQGYVCCCFWVPFLYNMQTFLETYIFVCASEIPDSINILKLLGSNPTS